MNHIFSPEKDDKQMSFPIKKIRLGQTYKVNSFYLKGITTNVKKEKTPLRSASSKHKKQTRETHQKY